MSPARLDEGGGPAAGIHEAATARREVYGLLSRMLRAPLEPADRARLLDAAMLEELADLFGAGAIEAWDRRTGPSGADLERRERQDFMDLLATPSGKFVRPWESVWCDEREVSDGRVSGRLCGPSTVEVEEAYREAGVQHEPRGLADLADNIAFETAFLEQLCAREGAAAAQGFDADAGIEVERQRRFVGRHLARWAPRLGEEMAARADTDLYRGLGAFLAAFVRAEADLLGSRSEAV